MESQGQLMAGSVNFETLAKFIHAGDLHEFKNFFGETNVNLEVKNEVNVRVAMDI
jgi:hypothetical protein